MSGETSPEYTSSVERLRTEYIEMREQHFGFSDLYAAEWDRIMAAHDEALRQRAIDVARHSFERGWEAAEAYHQFDPQVADHGRPSSTTTDQDDGIVHMHPAPGPGAQTTPCCDQLLFELPQPPRLSRASRAVTCKGLNP